MTATRTKTDCPDLLAVAVASERIDDATATALIDAGLYAYEARHCGGKGSIGWLFPAVADAPQYYEQRVNIDLSVWRRVPQQ